MVLPLDKHVKKPLTLWHNLKNNNIMNHFAELPHTTY